MEIKLSIILSFILAIVSTTLLMPWLLKLCYKRGIFDLPDERKVHKSNIPRLGGSVFVPCAMASFIVVLFSVSDVFPVVKTSTLTFGVSLMAVFVIGLLDDLFSLSASLRFLVQFVATTVFPLCGLYLDNLYGICGIYEYTPWLGYLLTIFLCMVIINAMNLIDGIDGLCSSLSMIGCGVYLYYFMECGNYSFAILCSALIGTQLVYLAYNLFGSIERETKTFMGDSGSLVLGFILAYMGLKLSSSNAVIAPPTEGIMIPIAVLFIPTIDLLRVALTRIAKGRHPFSADKTHIHHLLMQTGMPQRQTLITLIIADLIIIAITLSLCHANMNYTLIIAMDLILYALFIVYLLRKSKENAKKSHCRHCG